MKRPRRTTRAFTLLELILVMAIIATVLALASPSLRGFWRASHTNNAADQILAVLHWARTQAIADARVYRFNLDARENRYWLTVQQETEFVDLGSEFGREFLLPEEMRIALLRPDDTAVEFTDFFPNGSAEPALIRLTSPDGEQVDIVCLSPTEMYRRLDPGEEVRRR